MSTWQPDLDPIVGRIPRLFHLLKSLGDAMHADLGVTPAMRGVMASLAAQGPRTVPELARQRPVSRQHIQAVVDALTEAGLAETRSNPFHKRSGLVVLTPAGMRVFGEIRARDAALLARVAPAVHAADVVATVRLFDVLERELASLLVQTNAETVDA